MPLAYRLLPPKKPTRHPPQPWVILNPSSEIVFKYRTVINENTRQVTQKTPANGVRLHSALYKLTPDDKPCPCTFCGFQVCATMSTIRLKMTSFRPFVPSIDENYFFTLRQFLYGLFD